MLSHHGESSLFWILVVQDFSSLEVLNIASSDLGSMPNNKLQNVLLPLPVPPSRHMTGLRPPSFLYATLWVIRILFDYSSLSCNIVECWDNIKLIKDGTSYEDSIVSFSSSLGSFALTYYVLLKGASLAIYD